MVLPWASAALVHCCTSSKLTNGVEPGCFFGACLAFQSQTFVPDASFTAFLINISTTSPCKHLFVCPLQLHAQPALSCAAGIRSSKPPFSQKQQWTVNEDSEAHAHVECNGGSGMWGGVSGAAFEEECLWYPPTMN